MIVDNETQGLRRAWHVVAATEELGDDPLQVRLLGEAWVLARLGGEVRAFVDRCPHRLAPLSIGAVTGDELQCGYHGWRFGADGVATAIPALGEGATLPPRACLTPAFGVTERFGLVFMAPEEPLSPLPEFPGWSDAAFSRGECETVRTAVSAAQLIDNFMDAAHFPYVHHASFGVAEAGEVSVSEIVRDGWIVRSSFAAPYRNHDDPLVATGEHPLVQPHTVTKIGRADYLCELELRFELTGGVFWILYACTPERNGSTRVYKLIARNDLAHDPDRMAQVVKDEDQILGEDLAVLEAFHEMTLSLDPRTEVHTKADRLSVAWRRMLTEALEE